MFGGDDCRGIRYGARIANCKKGANSWRVSDSDLEAMIRVWPSSVIAWSTLLKSTNKAASVGGLWYPSLTTAFLAGLRIDFAAGLHWLHYRRIASAIACRTFILRRLRGRPFHFN